MVCLLQLSEQLHSSRWVQAQVRALLICDITTAAPWELIPNARQQLPAIRIDREELRAETHFCVCSCADSSLFFPPFFAWLCSRWSGVNNDIFHIGQMIVWSMLLWSLWSISSKRRCWTQTGEAIHHTHSQKKKKGTAKERKLQDVRLFVFRNHPFCGLASICI